MKIESGEKKSNKKRKRNLWEKRFLLEFRDVIRRAGQKFYTEI